MSPVHWGHSERALFTVSYHLCHWFLKKGHRLLLLVPFSLRQPYYKVHIIRSQMCQSTYWFGVAVPAPPWKPPASSFLRHLLFHDVVHWGLETTMHIQLKLDWKCNWKQYSETENTGKIIQDKQNFTTQKLKQSIINGHILNQVNIQLNHQDEWRFSGTQADNAT